MPYRLVLKQLVYAAITKRAAKEDPARYTGMRPPRAGMAELADAKVSKTFERKLMGVRSPLPAPFKSGTCSGRLNPPLPLGSEASHSLVNAASGHTPGRMTRSPFTAPPFRNATRTLPSAALVASVHSSPSDNHRYDIPVSPTRTSMLSL